MKRILALILSAALLLGTLGTLSGCSEEQVHILTRGEWISQVAASFGLTECYDSTPVYSDVGQDHPYFNAIQACAEWEIIQPEEEFRPEDRANVEFAIVTAVKAVGIDKIAKSVDGRTLTTDDEIVDYFNKKCQVSYIAGSSLYMDTAEQILSQINTLYSSLQLQQYQDIGYTDAVVTAQEDDFRFSADGETAEVVNGSYQVGDVIVIEPCETYPDGIYAKVTSVEGNVIKYTQPTMEEMFDHVVMYGTYEPEILGVIPLGDGVEVDSIGGAETELQSYFDEDGTSSLMYVKAKDGASAQPMDSIQGNLGDIEMSFSGELGATDSDGVSDISGSISAEGKVAVKNITATVDYEIWGIVPTRLDARLNNTVESSLSVKANLEDTIPVVKVPCKLGGVVGFNFVVAVKLGVNGEVSISVSLDTEESIAYKMFSAPKLHAAGSNPNLSAEIKAEAYLKPEFKAEFEIGPFSVAEIGAYGGVSASVSTTANVNMEGAGVCSDVSAYVPLTIFVGAETEDDDCLLAKLGVQKTWNIWTEENSPIHETWHIEDNQVVPECTRNGEQADSQPDESVLEGNTTEDEIDTDFIDFILDIDDYLVLSSYYVSLEEGATDTLRVTSLPEGYDAATLAFTSSDEAVASVENNGTIHANGVGSCVIRVATSDGLYQQSCAVTVRGNYDVEFTPLPAAWVGVGAYGCPV